jgi:4-hydroxybenzoate polyprenyltransferase
MLSFNYEVVSIWDIIGKAIYKLSRWSPLAWAFILLLLALLLMWVPTSFTKKLAILPGVIALFLFYQAFFRGKMY